MSENLWPELPPQEIAKVQAAIDAGNKLGAIKIYRDATGCGLKEAKEAIERAHPPASTNTSPQLPPDAAAQIQEALARRKPIEAIKIYRQATGCGLKEAKDAIDAMRSLREEVVRRPNSNWLTIVLTLLFITLVLIILLIRMR